MIPNRYICKNQKPEVMTKQNAIKVFEEKKVRSVMGQRAGGMVFLCSGCNCGIDGKS